MSEEQLNEFLDHADKAVKGAVRNSKRLVNSVKYEVLEKDLKTMMAIRSVNFFGSRIMNLGNHYSDLDIFLRFTSASAEELSRVEAVKKMFILKAKMASSPNWSVKIALYTATVPVLECFYKPLHLKCEFISKLQPEMI